MTPDKSAQPFRTAAGDSLPEELVRAAYAQLRSVASSYLAGRSGTVLQATSLVHEAFVRLAKMGRQEWENPSHFAATVATVMRRILVDEVRARLSQRRGGGWTRVELEVVPADGDGPSLELLALDEALVELAALSARQARVIELRYFGGLTVAETAEALGVGMRTVEEDWTIARAWLRRRIGGEEGAA